MKWRGNKCVQLKIYIKTWSTREITLDNSAFEKLAFNPVNIKNFLLSEVVDSDENLFKESQRVSDHFPKFLIPDPIISSEIKNRKTLLYKRTINTTTKENFQKILARKIWDYIKAIDNLNKGNSKFLYDFSLLRTLFQN